MSAFRWRLVGRDRSRQNKRFCVSKARRNLGLCGCSDLREGRCSEEAGQGVRPDLAGPPIGLRPAGAKASGTNKAEGRGLRGNGKQDRPQGQRLPLCTDGDNSPAEGHTCRQLQDGTLQFAGRDSARALLCWHRHANCFPAPHLASMFRAPVGGTRRWVRVSGRNLFTFCK